MSHTAEIIAVGTEILLGNIANTDAQDALSGCSAAWESTYSGTRWWGTTRSGSREALEIARKRADIILTTGGLGPTYDDLTKQTICEAFGQTLVLHEDMLEDIRASYARQRSTVPMPENNVQQAELPEGCAIFDNPVGTAPGCAFEAGRRPRADAARPALRVRDDAAADCALPYLRSLSRRGHRLPRHHDLRPGGKPRGGAAALPDVPDGKPLSGHLRQAQ